MALFEKHCHDRRSRQNNALRTAVAGDLQTGWIMNSHSEKVNKFLNVLF